MKRINPIPNTFNTCIITNPEDKMSDTDCRTLIINTNSNDLGIIKYNDIENESCPDPGIYIFLNIKRLLYLLNLEVQYIY